MLLGDDCYHHYTFLSLYVFCSVKDGLAAVFHFSTKKHVFSFSRNRAGAFFPLTPVRRQSFLVGLIVTCIPPPSFFPSTLVIGVPPSSSFFLCTYLGSVMTLPFCPDGAGLLLFDDSNCMLFWFFCCFLRPVYKLGVWGLFFKLGWSWGLWSFFCVHLLSTPLSLFCIPCPGSHLEWCPRFKINRDRVFFAELSSGIGGKKTSFPPFFSCRRLSLLLNPSVPPSFPICQIGTLPLLFFNGAKLIPLFPVPNRDPPFFSLPPQLPLLTLFLRDGWIPFSGLT